MIDESYREFLLNRIIGEYLRSGEIPYASQVDEDLNAALVDFPDQTMPWTSYEYEKLKVKENTPSSARTYNRFFGDLAQDMQVLQKECLKIDTTRSITFARNLQEIQMLQSRIRALQHQLNSQLLVNQETVGYGAYIADNFSDAGLVDLGRTTANVDLDHHCVTIGSGTKTFTQYSTKELTQSDVVVNIINRIGLVRSQPNLGDVQEAFNSDDSSWRMQLFFDNDNRDVVIEVIIQLQKQPVILNRIAFTNYGITTYRTKLEAFTSTDNYNWIPLPTGDPFYYFDQSVDLRFADQEARWVKFRFTKDHYDFQQGSYFVYEFGAKSFMFFRQSYQEDGALLISKPLAILNDQGEPAIFNQVSLQVCESLPDVTDIKYELSFDGGDIFMPISPVNRPGDSNTLIELGTTEDITSTRFGLDMSTTYHYLRSNLALLDFSLPSNIIDGSLTIWRNVGTRGVNISIRNGLSGWGQDGQYYVCAIKIINDQGLSINLGSTFMEINGVSRTGSVFLGAGTYSIRTHKSNWSHLQFNGSDVTNFVRATDLTDGTFSGYHNGVNLVVINDPLYPYNHKFLIEGMAYANPNMVSGLPYLGADLFAESKMIMVSEKDLAYGANFDAIDYCAPVEVIGVGGVEQRFVVGYLPQTSNAGDRFDLEEFQAFYKQSVLTDVNNVVFKATLSRGTKEVTPQLFSYIIKLAN